MSRRQRTLASAVSVAVGNHSRQALTRRRMTWGLAFLALGGCQPGASPAVVAEAPADPGTRAAHSARESSPATSGAEAREVVLETVDRAGFDAALLQLRGQVVLVDFWATWCSPCREQMRHTAQLVERYRDEGLAALSLSLDDPADERAVSDARTFLSTLGPEFPHLLSAQGGSDESYDEFAIDNGAIPHLQLYDREGKLIRKFASGDPASRQATPGEIEAAVRAALSLGDAEAGATAAPAATSETPAATPEGESPSHP